MVLVVEEAALLLRLQPSPVRRCAGVAYARAKAPSTADPGVLLPYTAIRRVRYEKPIAIFLCQFPLLDVLFGFSGHLLGRTLDLLCTGRGL